MFIGTTRLFQKLIPILILIPAVLGLSGCGPGLPDQVKQKAEEIPGAIEKSRTSLEDQRKKFAVLVSSPDFNPFASYAQKENWESNFQNAAAGLDRADHLFKQELKPLIKQDKPELSGPVTTQTLRINKVIKEAGQQARYPFERFAKFKIARENMAGIQKEAQDQDRKIQALVNGLEGTEVAKAKTDFPDAVEKIDARFAPFVKMRRDCQSATQTIDKEVKNQQAGQAVDLALFVDSADAVAKDYAISAESEKKFKSAIAGLYQSYTKVLQDMKQEYGVIIKRESWDERSDYNTSRIETYTTPVDAKTFEALNDTELESIASIVPGFSSSSLKNRIGPAWDALNINPTLRWPSGHNAAEFWVDQTEVRGFHKYLLEEDGNTRETDWQEVKPSFYEQNYENLGMAIVSKPYGVFEEDCLTQAAPPGMACVGNPEYGEWKTDNNGDRFWSWYGRYAFFSNLFFFPSYYYSYRSWRGWHDNYRYKKPYYGTTSSGGKTFGTFGSKVKTTPRYQSSTFSRSGGLKTRTPSVRGAGSRVRGGGPGGRGK